MAQYACTNCLQWFQFAELSEEKQLCKACVGLKPAKLEKKPKRKDRSLHCKYCQTNMKDKRKFDGNVCERCHKNLNQHGEPKVCVYCTLQSAFIGSKCQRCSSSQKKYGLPVKCEKCGLKAAFDHNKARVEGLVLCWVCYVLMQKDRGLKRKLGVQSSTETTKKSRESPSHKSPQRDSPQEVWKELLGEDQDYRATNSKPEIRLENKEKKDLRKQAQINSQKKKSKNNDLDKRISNIWNKMKERTPTSDNSSATSTPTRNVGSNTEVRSDNEGTPNSNKQRRNGGNIMDTINILPSINDNNIVVVTKLREEISSLKKQSNRKDQVLIDKEKQISMLKVEHLTEVRSLQARIKSQEEDFLKNIETYRLKNQELLKKISQLSKGKA